MPGKSAARKRRDFCEPLAEELASLADLLHASGACRDIVPLTAAAADAADAHAARWHYDIAKLTFPLNPAENRSLPIVIADLQCTLDLRVGGPIPDDPATSLSDPFDDLVLNLRLHAKTPGGARTELAWHLDRHPHSAPTAAHPRYHWQCGGFWAEDLSREL